MGGRVGDDLFKDDMMGIWKKFVTYGCLTRRI